MSKSTTGESAVAEPGETSWSEENWSLIVLFTLLTVVGVVLTTGVLELGVVDTQPNPSAAIVPVYVYLYATLGALGYAFTKLMTSIESFTQAAEIDRLVELALRIPAAWILGAGTYLLANILLPDSTPDTARFTAGVAFLVGLYVNVVVKSLGSLADRLLGRGKQA